MEMTRGEMADHLSKFAADNPDYRQALRDNPKDIVTRQFGIQVPDNISLKVVEDSADTIHVVLPHAVAAGDELSDSDLEAVAGGGFAMVKEANCEGGIAATVVQIEAGL